MADIFDEIAGQVSSGGSTDMFDQIAAQVLEAPADTSPSLGQSARFVGKSFLEGGANVLDLINKYAIPGKVPDQTPPIFHDLFKEYVGSPWDEGIAPTPVAKYANAAMQGTAFPVGGAVPNALMSMGGLAGQEALPEHPVIGGLLGGVATGAGLAGLSSLGKGLASGADELANTLDRKSLGTRASDYGKASSTRTIESPEGVIETRVKSQLDSLLEEGKLGKSRDPTKLLKAIDEESSALGNQLTAKITDYDAIDPITGVRQNPPAIPEFNVAREYLASGRVPADLIGTYSKRLDDLETAIAAESKGNLSYLQRQKIAFGKSWDPADKVKSGFDRAIYTDLKNSVEEYVPEARGINAELSKYMTAEPIATRSLRAAENASPLSSLRDLTYTTGGIGAGGIIGGIVGGPVGSAVGIGAGIGLRGLASPAGQAAIARGLRMGASVTRSAAETVWPLQAPSAQFSQRASVREALSEPRGANLRPSQVTSAEGTLRPSTLETARTMPPESTVTDTLSPSQKYSPEMSLEEISGNPRFISHYNNITKQAPDLENLLKKVAGDSPIKMRTKGASEAAGKILRKVRAGKKDYNEQSLGDLIGGRIMTPGNKEALDTLDRLKATGTIEGPVENYLLRPNEWGYEGINANVRLPNGAIAEVQIATPESIRIKDAIRPIYNEMRGKDVSFEALKRSRLVAARAMIEANDIAPSNLVKGAPGSYPTVELPVARLKLSDEVKNFKAGANERGVVTPLEGKFERRGLAPIAVWERKNGDLEVISGRHRWDLAVRSGEDTIPSQIFKEKDGFTASHARRLDAELNILSEQGAVTDYSKFFKEAGLSREQAASAGLLSRTKGKQGFAIGSQASEEVFSAHQAGKITDAQAVAIVEAAPNNADLQRAGITLVDEGVHVQEIGPAIKELEREAKKLPAAQQVDMFGADSRAIQAAVNQSKAATTFRSELDKKIRSAQGAAKNPQDAAELGVDAKDPTGTLSKIEKLKAERERWAEWRKHDDLKAKVAERLKSDSGSANIGGLFGVGIGATLFGGAMAKDLFDGNQDVEEIEKEIDSDPFDAAVYKAESDRNPLAKNPESSASGGFQLIKSTAKNLGVKDVFDLKQNYEGFKKLKAENIAALKSDDPKLLYMAHYLGAPVLKKWLAGESLTDEQQEQIRYLKAKALPRFMNIYNSIVKV